MAIQFIPNQPIRFNSAKFDDQACINKDLSAYLVLMQPGDPLKFQMKQTCCEEGLQCDMSEEGAELVAGGSFAADAFWTKGAGWTISGGQAHFAAGAPTILSQTVVTTIGRPHKVTIEVTSNDDSGIISITLGDTFVGMVSTVGTHTFYVTPKCNSLLEIYAYNFDLSIATSPDMSIDNVSVRPLAECYIFDTSDTDEAVNGTFTGSATGWDLANFAYGANAVTKSSGAVVGYAKQTLPNVRYRQCYTITFTISGYGGAGSLEVRFGNVILNSYAGNGTFTISHPMATTIDGVFGKKDLVFVDVAGTWTGTLDTVSFVITDSGWEFSENGGLCHITGYTNAFYAGNTLQIGQYMQLTVEVSMSAGRVLVEAGGVNLGYITKSGIYKFYFTTLTQAGERFTPSADFDGCILPTIDLCALRNDYQFRLIYENGAVATDWYTSASTNPLVYTEDYVTWSLTTLTSVLSGGVLVESQFSCFRMQVLDFCADGDVPTTWTSDSLINYKSNHDCTKVIRAWCEGIGLNFNFGTNGNLFILQQRYRTLYFNPSYPISGEDYQQSNGTIKRNFAQLEKKYDLLFDYMDEYAHDTVWAQIGCDIFEMDGVEYVVPFKDYEPDWGDRGKRNLAQSRIEIQKRIESTLFNRNCT